MSRGALLYQGSTVMSLQDDHTPPGGSVEYKGNGTGWKSRTEVQRAGGDRSMNRSIEVLCSGFMGHPVAKGISEDEGLLCHSILHNSVTESLNKLVS